VARKNNYYNFKIGRCYALKKEIVRAFVDAFNVNNYARGIIKTNFKLQSRNNEDCIIILLDKGMGHYQCEEYLHDVKRKIMYEFYDTEENRYEMAGVVKLIFNVASFPFSVSEKGWSLVDKQDRVEFATPVNDGVLIHLKSHMAASLAKDVCPLVICLLKMKAPNEDYL